MVAINLMAINQSKTKPVTYSRRFDVLEVHYFFGDNEMERCNKDLGIFIDTSFEFGPIFTTSA